MKRGKKMVEIIISLILAVIIVNAAQKLFMDILNIDFMFYSIRSKLIAIGVVFMLVLYGILTVTGQI